MPNLDILPGSPSLAQADVVLDSSARPITALAEALRPARGDYDFILIDCAPTLSLLNINTLIAADALIVPVSLSYLAVEGLATFDIVARKVWSARGRMVPVLGILRTIFDTSVPAQREMSQVVLRKYGGKVFQATIRECQNIPAASRSHRTLFDHSPDAACAHDYAALALEVEDRAARYSHVFPRVLCTHVPQEASVIASALGA